MKNAKYDEALGAFKKVYSIDANNSIKTYYALVRLASISIKPQTVKFMREKIGLEKYPDKLDVLVNLKEWWEEQKSYPEVHYTILLPNGINRISFCFKILPTFSKQVRAMPILLYMNYTVLYSE